MSNFAALLSAFVGDVESGRVHRIQRNVEMFGLSETDAQLLDEYATGMVREVARLIGKRADDCSHDVLRASALLLIPETVGRNLAAVSDFLNSVVVATAIEGIAITAPNPLSPECDCENCQLARAASQVLAIPTAPSSVRH